MVNVYTNNGQFNITESLMEAIKANNPELLVERGTKYYTNKNNDDTEENDITREYDSFLDRYAKSPLSSLTALGRIPFGFKTSSK